MADLPSWDDLFRVGEEEILSRNTRLTKEVIEREGSDANALVAASTAIGHELVGQLACLAASLYLDSSTDVHLDRLVFDRYGLVRKPASASFGSVTFSLPAANPSDFSISTGTRLAATDGKVFLTAEDAIFLAGSAALLVAVRSAQAGASQAAKIGSIANILDFPPGAPATLTVTNAFAAAGAADRERDESLRDRARRFFTTARRGTVAAIEAGALAVPGVRRAVAFETLDDLGRPAKHLQLVVADQFTDQLAELATVPPTYQTQSQVLAGQVFDALADVRAAGVFVQVSVAQAILQSVKLGLSFQAGVSVDSVALQARAAVVAHVNSLDPGESLTVVGMIGAIQSIDGLVVTGDEILSPAGDVVPTQLQVMRTTLGLVAATSLQPDRALQGSANPDAV